MKKNRDLRPLIQSAAALLMNINISGFINGKIFTGKTKMTCVPGLNCYSCPGAIGACPIGALQSVISGRKYDFSFYVVGILLFFSAVLGRVICGFLCPFGFVQDLLYKVQVRKLTVPKHLDKFLRYVKYIVLVVFVLVLPAVLVNAYGLGEPQFCKWLCPVGTLEGGIPLVIMNESLHGMLGFLWNWKLCSLGALLLSSVFIYHPFCKYLCPLGAFYGLFNGKGLTRMRIDQVRCTGCGLCERTCKMQVEVRKCINSPECIRCGDCKRCCPTDAISMGYMKLI